MTTPFLCSTFKHWTKTNQGKTNEYFPKTSKEISFHSHHRNFISKNTIAIAVTSSSSSSAAFCFANITASPQHSRKGAKTCSNTLQPSATSPDAKYFPLPSNATDVTKLVWPLSSATCCCVLTSHILTVLSLEPVKKRRGGRQPLQNTNRNTLQQNKISNHPKNMLHTSAATSRIMRICTCFHKCAYITVKLHSTTPYTT